MEQQRPLNLGAALSTIIKNADLNFTDLYKAIANLQNTIYDGGSKAIVYTNVDKMKWGLNANQDENGNTISLNVGDEIYVLDADTPDFWVSAVNDYSYEGKLPTEWEENQSYIFGIYAIRVSKGKVISEENLGKIKDVLVNGVSVVDEDGNANIVIENNSGADYQDIYTDSDVWVERTLNGTKHYAIKLDDEDTTVELLNEQGQAIAFQMERDSSEGVIYLIVGSKINCSLRKIGGNTLNGGSGGNGTKKYLHCVRLRIGNPVTEETEKDESGIFFKRRFTLYNTKIYIVSENEDPISSLSGLEILDMSNGVLNCVEEEYENLGEADSEDELLNSNTYSFPIFNLSKIGDTLTVFASGTKTNVEFDYASLSNLISVGEGINVDVYDIPIIVEATVSNNYKNFNVSFYPTNYSVESDTVTEL